MHQEGAQFELGNLSDEEFLAYCQYRATMDSEFMAMLLEEFLACE